jgi:RNA polymerase sigma-70 factor, ECF subfamily
MEEAEDLTQETFLRAYEHMDRFRPDGNERAWLYRICINLARDKWRRRQFFARDVEPIVRSGNLFTSPKQTPQSQAELSEQTCRIMKAMKTLAGPFHDVIVLRHFEELPTEEVAMILGIPANTVRSRLKRAREQLIRQLT